MQTVLEQGSIDKPLTFDVGMIQLSFIPVCTLNTCNISVKLCRGFALQCFSCTVVVGGGVYGTVVVAGGVYCTVVVGSGVYCTVEVGGGCIVQ